MGELSGVPIGIVTQLAAGNPIATFATGMLSVLVVLGVAVRLYNNSRRSDKIDKAADGFRDSLAKRVETLEIQNTTKNAELLALMEKFGATETRLATALAKLEALQQRLASVETENMRLRDENAGQEIRLRQCDIEARAAQGKIAALERQVRDLEQRQGRNSSDSNDADGNI